MVAGTGKDGGGEPPPPLPPSPSLPSSSASAPRSCVMASDHVSVLSGAAATAAGPNLPSTLVVATMTTVGDGENEGSY